MTRFDDATWEAAGGRPRSVSVTVSRLETFTDEDEVRRWLEGQRGDGWICCTSEVRRWTTGDPLPDGVPLRAELAISGEQASVTLRREGGGWTAWKTIEDDAREPEHLAFDLEFLSTEVAGSAVGPGSSAEGSGGAKRRALRLAYRQYWRGHGEGEGPSVEVWRPFAARFLGWREEAP